jgi:Asparaginase, N-terminal
MDLLRYLASGNPRLTGEQMLESLPEIAKVAGIVVDIGNPHAQGSYDDLRKLALGTEEVLKSPDITAWFYVQGTNTLEETAYFLTVHSDKPVVVTGSQRPFNGLSSDAQMNLFDAVRLASAPESRPVRKLGRGGSSKVVESRLVNEAMASGSFGPIRDATSALLESGQPLQASFRDGPAASPPRFLSPACLRVRQSGATGGD